MSMMPVKHMTDDELKAIFAYLKTIKPIKNNICSANTSGISQEIIITGISIK